VGSTHALYSAGLEFDTWAFVTGFSYFLSVLQANTGILCSNRSLFFPSSSFSIYHSQSSSNFVTCALHQILLGWWKSRTMRRAQRVTRIGDIRNAYKILVGKRERKTPIGITRRRWEDNIRMDLRERGLEGVDWMHLTQNMDQWRAVVNTVTNVQVP
jgi:hypothetical protein